MVNWWTAAADAGNALSPAILAGAATVIAALIAAVSAVKVRDANRKLDDATARKSDAEAASFEVRTARDLLTDVQSWSERRLSEVRADYEQRISALRERHGVELKSLTEGQADLHEQMRALRAAFAAHQTWDADAVAMLRTMQPDYPPPPPIAVDQYDDQWPRRRRPSRRAEPDDFAGGSD